MACQPGPLNRQQFAAQWCTAAEGMPLDAAVTVDTPNGSLDIERVYCDADGRIVIVTGSEHQS